MIAFSCHQCGQVYERPATEAGTLIFCDCGAANTVPWESVPVADPVPVAMPVPEAMPVSAEQQPVVVAHAACFTHPGAASSHTCDACGLGFCDDCLVRLDNRRLCGPCKNVHVRSLHRTPDLALSAVFSLIVALVAAPFTLVLLFMGLGMENREAVVTCTLVGLAPQMLALMLGVYAISKGESEPRRGGRSLAISGVVASLVSTILAVETAIQFLRILE